MVSNLALIQERSQRQDRPIAQRCTIDNNNKVNEYEGINEKEKVNLFITAEVVILN